jgi:type IV secretory pathway protease TraF
MIWKLVRLVTLGALVAAVVAAPAFATESQTSKLVQIGGQLVPPSQLSQFESQLGQPVSRSSQLVQIGGQLVPPSQLSQFESQLGQPVSRSSQLVQIGGHLVPPSQLSSAERQLSAAWLAANGSSGSSSHVLRDLGYGAVALFTVALLVAAGTVARRRYEPTTA